MMVETQNDIAVVNAKVHREATGLDIGHDDSLLSSQMEPVNEFLSLLVSEAFHR